jgi:tRNA G37 N-methylase Trm5
MDSTIPTSNNIKSMDDFPADDIWNETIEFPALRVPVHATARIRQLLKSVLWRHARGGGGASGRPNVYPDPQQPSKYRILILQQQQQQQQHSDGDEKMAAGLDDNQQDQPKQQQDRLVQQILEQNTEKITVDNIQQTTFTMNFTYADYTVEQAMRKILPTHLHDEIPCSFESVGPIAHVNLRAAYVPFQYWIGKILLDKNQPRIQTVVTKIGNIDNEYRTFGMRIIAQAQQQHRNKSHRRNKNDDSFDDGNNINNNSGDNDWSIVTVKEEKCTFTLDFQKVYWNSRLAGEHRRLVQEIQKYANAKRQRQPTNNAAVTVVADLMAGVGPFAIPLTAPFTSVKKQKKKNTQKKVDNSQESPEPPSSSNNNNMILVYANDLNPDSYNYLKINAQQNKCRVPQDLICSNQDARALLAQLQKNKVVIDHVIMNLPASAPEFLDMFRGYKNNSPAATALSTEGDDDDDDDVLSKPPPPSSEPNGQTKAVKQPSSACCDLPRIHVYCFAPKPAPLSQGEQTKKPCAHDDDKSSNSSHAPTNVNQADRRNTNTDNGNDDNHYHDYQESLDRCAKALGIDALDRQRDDVHIHVVRDVSPQKNMICISFQLPFQVTTLPTMIVPSFSQERSAAAAVVVVQDTKTKSEIDDCSSGVNGNPTSHVVDVDQDEKRKRIVDPIFAKAPACTEKSVLETDPNKRSKGASII